MEMKRLVAHPLSIGRELATKRIIRQFARKFDLVYFGGVDSREEDYELIRGATLSTSHVDGHYCVGHYKNHDISLVERRNTMNHSTHQPPMHVDRWLIMQVDLRRREGLPHVFVDATQYDNAFYDRLRLRVANLSYAGSLFVGHDPLFAQSFRVFAPIDRFDDTAELLNPAVTSMLAHHFSQFDYEIGEDRILVYAYNPMVSLHLLHEMLRVGSWLAMQLDWIDKG